MGVLEHADRAHELGRERPQSQIMGHYYSHQPDLADLHDMGAKRGKFSSYLGRDSAHERTLGSPGCAL